MKKEWDLTEEAFERLLQWLDADREQAGRKYEIIRIRLIRIFTCRGCLEAEDLADEAINRVTAKLDEIIDTYIGEPAPYFYGVANKLHLEYLRRKPPAELPQNLVSGSQESEQRYSCLEECIAHLSPASRQLVLNYYQDEKRAKIDHRKQLADSLGIAANALRIRAHRIRLRLQECVKSCLSQQPAH